MLLVEILWVSLVLGGFIASLWHWTTWRGNWYRLARVRVEKQPRSVWQRPHDEPATGPPGTGRRPSFPQSHRAAPPPRPQTHGYGSPSAPGARRARRG